MKTCTIFGNMQSERTADQYPTVTLCNDCIKQDSFSNEDSQIVTLGDYEKSYGDSCEWCGVTAEDEQAAVTDSRLNRDTV